MDKRVQYVGTILFLCSFIYIVRVVSTEVFEDETHLVDEWLEQNDLGEFKKLFKEHGISTLSGCGSPNHLEKLPELPADDEKRLRRAAMLLQQKLVLKEWLATFRLHHIYSRLSSLDVTTLEDLYWLDDSITRHVLDPKDFQSWTVARQNLPTDKDVLQTLKSDLWNAVVLRSKHRDAWTWGGMLVVSISVCGMVTLAALTQPSLAPEAKHSLLQYVTGKYLHPPSCKVEWGWEEPYQVGDTMNFTVLCFQRNGQPYPISEDDELSVSIIHGTRKDYRVIVQVSEVVELGAGEAHMARVHFTVRVAGMYLVTVLIDTTPIEGSPFRRVFAPQPMCAGASRVGVAGGGGAGGAAWGPARAPLPLHLHPRDTYDNAALPQLQDFTVKICRLGCEPEPELSSNVKLKSDLVNQRITMTLCFEEPGLYHAAVYYNDELLLNGEFDCIILTASAAATVSRSVSMGWSSFSARLLAARAAAARAPAARHTAARPRRVLLCVSHTHVTLKDYFLKVFPKRITSFRLCPSTKLILSSDPVGPEGGAFTLDDGVQAPLQLVSHDRDLIAATFTQLLCANCGGEDTFKNKQEFFYSSLRKVHTRHAHDKLSLRVVRADLLRSSLKATRHLTQADWCKNFDITFQGEQGVDWGGVRREWFSLLCAQLFDAKYGLFVPFHDSASGLVHPNPDRPPHLKLKHFELAGKLVGKCLYESALGGSYRQLVRARFTRAFLAQLIGLRVHYKYFEQDDPELFLSKIKYVLETDLEAGEAPELHFAEDVYDSCGKLKETHDLIPNGSTIRVTNSSKVSYLDALAQWRLAARVRSESEAFLRGLACLVPHHLLAIFDETELELLVCGTGEVCVSDWRSHALVSGSGRDWERSLSWFWAALSNFTTEERARVLQFATGSSQLPSGGFQELNPRFQITAAPNFGALPTAHTCFNQLCLPEYDSYEQLVHAVLWAVNEGGEGFAMV